MVQPRGHRHGRWVSHSERHPVPLLSRRCRSCRMSIRVLRSPPRPPLTVITASLPLPHNRASVHTLVSARAIVGQPKPAALLTPPSACLRPGQSTNVVCAGRKTSIRPKTATEKTIPKRKETETREEGRDPLQFPRDLKGRSTTLPLESPQTSQGFPFTFEREYPSIPFRFL